MNLAREPKARLELASGDNKVLKSNAKSFSRWGRYFFALMITNTSEITAQSIITKLNKSSYVTIGISSFHFYSGSLPTAPSVPWVNSPYTLFNFLTIIVYHTNLVIARLLLVTLFSLLLELPPAFLIHKNHWDFYKDYFFLFFECLCPKISSNTYG